MTVETKDEPKVAENNKEALLDKDRLLSQHQAALTLVKSTLQDPEINNFEWLDLACGKGQIIANLNSNLPKEMRSKIKFYGYDIAIQYSNVAEDIASQMELKDFQFRNGSLHDFGTLYDVNTKFDFISLINAVHEIDAWDLSLILFESFIRLNENGTLFIFDMEKLPKLEVGSVTWRMGEIRAILSSFFDAMGSSYRPAVSLWSYKTCDCWDVQIKKSHTKVNDIEIFENKEHIISKTSDVINEQLKIKFEITKRVLQSVTKKGSQIADEDTDVKYAVYDFWALNRAMEKLI